MTSFHDCFGRDVRLTDERLAHILEHPEMRDMDRHVGETLARPSIVRKSKSDDSVRLFYVFHEKTLMGGKWLCVVVKYGEDDAFVVTAYLTDRPKEGEELWPTR